ncbi:MAG: peroxiredoxin [Desulfurococcales archaeon ex4484_217_2]|nr:MAG: peroxiredoxin [Desulfurococcales archaeon ex4484_217_2]
MVLQPGMKAPDFEIEAYKPDTDEIVKVKLSDFKGKWVILCFYPADFTFVCSTELAAMAHAYNTFKELNVEVVSISTDTVFDHKGWVEQEPLLKGRVKFLMGSDPTGKVARTYGVYSEESGVAFRGRFIIDPDGVIQAYEVVNLSMGRNVNELIRQIKALQYIREHPDEVTPAQWKPGKPTIKPSIKISGKVGDQIPKGSYSYW